MNSARSNHVILASQHSGSALICNWLSQTEVAGKPNEYFTHWNPFGEQTRFQIIQPILKYYCENPNT